MTRRILAKLRARRPTRLQRLLNDHHQAESDRLWAEFDTTQPMPGTDMEEGERWATVTDWREQVTRGCGDQHTGICWTERFHRWWPDKAPKDQYPNRSDWARLGPDGWQPRSCREPAGWKARS